MGPLRKVLKMSDTLKPGLGAVLAISVALPADETIAGYEALTWLVVGEVTDIPEFGPAHEVVTHIPLATGITAKYHGAKNNGSITVPMALDVADPGQAIVRSALLNKKRHSFSVTYIDGAVDYFQGKVFSFTRGANISAVVTASVNIEIETDITEDTGVVVTP
jgi:Lambda phage tail tube protein, TTP